MLDTWEIDVGIQRHAKIFPIDLSHGYPTTPESMPSLDKE